MRWLKRQILALTLVGVGIMPAAAQHATWLLNPGSGDFNTAANWTPATVPTGTAFFGVSNTTALSFSAGTSLDSFTFNAGASAYTFTNGVVLSFNGAGIVINGGSATITNNAFIFFNGTSTAGSATIDTAGAITFADTTTAGNAIISNSLGGTLSFTDTSTAGNAQITTTNALTQFTTNANPGNAQLIANAAGIVDVSNTTGANNDNRLTAGSIAGAGNYYLGPNQLTVGGNNLSTTVSGVISDCGSTGLDCNNSGAVGGSLVKTGTGTLTLSGVNTYTGGTTINAGTLLLSGVGTPGAPTGTITVNGGILDLGGTSLTSGALTTTGGTIQNGTLTSSAFNVQDGTIAAVLAGAGALTKSGAATVTLSGANTYTGSTTVNAGTLLVTGSIASSNITVNNGAILGGTGTLGTTTINSGGTLAPGASIGTIAVSGNLTFNAGSNYAVEVAPATADRTNVTGTASLAGTVQAAFQTGSYVVNTYTLLSATGGRTGTFQSLTTTNLPANFSASLSYTSTDVRLNLTAALGNGGGLGAPQQNVANTINNFFNGGGTMPADFVSLFGLTGANLANALSQVSGENANGLSLAAFQAMAQFLGVMIDPLVENRGGNVGGPLAFGPAADLPLEVAAAYAALMPVKAPPVSPGSPWTVWGSATGGYSKVNGNAAIGSNDTTTRAYGFAAGADYRLNPSTILGFSISGGGTNWGLANALGTGRSDALHVGVYGSHRFAGAAYVSAALGYAHHWVDTERSITLPAAARYRADFAANVVAGRIETGYRVALRSLGVTPYAALQAIAVKAPAYGETTTSGTSAFALSYASRTATTTRTELGAWFDLSRLIGAGRVMTLRARAAWAHNWYSDPSVSASFLTLSGTNFTVNGAPLPRDAALLSAASEFRLCHNLALLARFDSELAARARSYTGTATIRYVW